MAVRVIRENNRSEGRTPATGVTIIAGQLLKLAAGLTVDLCDNATVPYGVAAESTAPLPIAPASGLTAGQGFDYTNFARGGLVSAFITGSELELYDDGHGSPIAAGTYALNAPVYAGSAGQIDDTGTVVVGYVVDFDQAVNPNRLRVKFVI